MTREQLSYFVNVLGIEEFIHSQGTIVSASENTPSNELRFGSKTPQVTFFQICDSLEESLQQGEASTLFNKMCAAMKLKEWEVLELKTDEYKAESLHQTLLASSPQIIVGFGLRSREVLQGLCQLEPSELVSWEGVGLISTFSPHHLISHPSDKKQTWNDLQKVMEGVGKE